MYSHTLCGHYAVWGLRQRPRANEREGTRGEVAARGRNLASLHDSLARQPVSLRSVATLDDDGVRRADGEQPSHVGILQQEESHREAPRLAACDDRLPVLVGAARYFDDFAVALYLVASRAGLCMAVHQNEDVVTVDCHKSVSLFLPSYYFAFSDPPQVSVEGDFDILASDHPFEPQVLHPAALQLLRQR